MPLRRRGRQAIAEGLARHGSLFPSDAPKFLWGTGQLSVSRPPVLTGAWQVFGTYVPYYNLFILLLSPAIALAFWFVLHRTRAGRLIRAAALDREMLGALGINVNRLYTGVFVIGSFLASIDGALRAVLRRRKRPRHA